MSNAKHTPGPWYVEILKDHGTDSGWMISIQAVENLDEYSEDDPSIAGIYTIEPKDAANARLISAAPELLEALELAFGMAKIFHRDTDDVWSSAKSKIESAIAKAKGETL